MFGALTGAAAFAGMDPGLQVANAEQVRGDGRFIQSPEAMNLRYQLIAVAEQGSLQDSRPFAIVSAQPDAIASYHAGGPDRVSPFFFRWNRVNQEPGFSGVIAELLLDTASEPYFYRNHPSAQSSSGHYTLRDLPREIYRQLPADHANPSRSQLLNSLDDHAHLAFFERDSVTPGTSYLGDLSTLGYAAKVHLPEPEIRQLQDFAGYSNRTDVGSRVVVSVSWVEDTNSDGVGEVYLVEINLGGRSGLDHWQSEATCVKDNDSHASIISGQYLVLGQDLLRQFGHLFELSSQAGIADGFGNPAAWQQIVVPWGAILENLTQRSSGDCRLRASLNALPNTIGVGFAIEAKGAVRQSLSIADVVADRQSSLLASMGQPLSVADSNGTEPVVLVTTQENVEPEIGIAEVPAAAIIEAGSNPASGSSTSGDACLAETNLAHGFYSYAGTAFYANGSSLDSGTAAYCLNPELPVGVVPLRVCGFPPDRINDGLCQPVNRSLDENPQSNTIVESNVEAGGESDAEAGDMDLPPRVTDGSIIGMEFGWFEVQSADGLHTWCEGLASCDVPPGRYIVINHSTGQRWHNLVVYGAGPEVNDSNDEGQTETSTDEWLLVDGRIQWLKPDHWFQVQSAIDYQTVCEGTSDCLLQSGIYNIIDHSSGKIWSNILVVDGTP